MANTNFNTSNETLRKLLGNGLTYRIPSFQRDYSWTPDEWEDLWDDITAMFEPGGEDSHYMGYLVLQSSDSKQHDIIDGQQRLTTLSIIILAAISHLTDLAAGPDKQEGERDRRRAEQLRNSYIGYLDPVSLVPRSKLSLNRHNNRFYQTYMVPLEPMPQRNLRASEHALRKAFIWFKRVIKDRCKQSGEETARLIDGIVDKLFFTVITVTDELNAFKVFETLNARGVRLSSTDLLKNYLFSIVSQGDAHELELESMEGLWEQVVGALGSESLPEFLRVFWNSRHRLVRKADLFKTIRERIRDRESAFKLVRDLDSSAHIYAALRSPEDELWEPNEKELLEELQLYGVRQHLSMMLAAYHRFHEADRPVFISILKAVKIISFRYNVIGSLQANEQERVYNHVAVGISKGNLADKVSIIAALKAIYPEDVAFRGAFEEKEFVTTNTRSRKLVRYTLFQLEKHVGQADYDPQSARINIEHVCPENPEGTDWDEETEKHVYRLGNMVLMNAAVNRDIGNKTYAAKRGVLAASDHALARYLAENYDEWNVEKITAFQKYMARQATSIWRLDS